MRTTATLDAPCPPEVLFAHVDRLDRYPAWMPLVHRAEPVDADPDGPAWAVELRTRVGPLARSKRLRMVRTLHEPARRVVFQRRELDGRDHASWELIAAIDPSNGHDCRLTMHLAYGGSLWTGGVLQRILDDEIRRASDRLLELVSASPTP
ncbi:MAG: SRPBCC family protein [Ilumatobacteraceae bacterium]